jgi:HEAT repeat protein
VEAAQRELQRPEPEVRAAALQLLYAHADLLPAEAAVWQRLATHLGEPYKQVRDRAQALLTQCPLDLGPVLGPYLESPSWITARAAVQCVTDAGQRDLLQNLLRQLVKQLWVYTLVLRTPVALDTLSGRYWNLCLENARDRTRKLIFDVLAGLENQKLIRSVEKVLRFSNLRARADALEVLSNLGDREAAQMLVLLLETGDLEHKLSSLSGSLVRASEWSASPG